MKRTLAVALVTLLALASCGGETETIQDQAGPATDTESETSEASQADQAPGLVVDKIGGGQIDVAALAGEDAVLWFWAPW